jgi:hypothetical protein
MYDRDHSDMTQWPYDEQMVKISNFQTKCTYQITTSVGFYLDIRQISIFYTNHAPVVVEVSSISPFNDLGNG